MESSHTLRLKSHQLYRKEFVVSLKENHRKSDEGEAESPIHNNMPGFIPAKS
jgi:hypothetical protein